MRGGGATDIDEDSLLSLIAAPPLTPALSPEGRGGNWQEPLGFNYFLFTPTAPSATSPLWGEVDAIASGEECGATDTRVAPCPTPKTLLPDS
jgi:hypothetical protein